MQVQREFSDTRVVNILSTKDEKWIAEALTNAEELYTLKERIKRADAQDGSPSIGGKVAFSDLKRKYAS
ncbi:MAG: hypothetical protein HOA38_09315 [Candidatus Marinimicrobia bacterium]|jgi:cation transport regulator ChaB|nr:hypothetical protein [Candidatus Neomarinimicrobiota bacterium]